MFECLHHCPPDISPTLGNNIASAIIYLTCNITGSANGARRLANTSPCPKFDVVTSDIATLRTSPVTQTPTAREHTSDIPLHDMHTLRFIHPLETGKCSTFGCFASVRILAFTDLVSTANSPAFVAYRLKTWTRTEGQIRLSEDDGPPVREFLEDDYDEDNEELPAEESRDTS
jgi:hypothetical protein